MPTVEKLVAREVFDSRGYPTVEVEVVASCGSKGRAIASSGGSVGRHEAVELRDSDHPRHGGRGVRRAVALVASEIAPALKGMDVDDQDAIDAALVALDGTPDKARLGSHVILATSMAIAQAAGGCRGEELYVHLNRLWKRKLRPGERSEPAMPMPMAHMISGLAQVGRTLDFQDILIVPVAARDYSEAVAMVAEVYRALGEILHKHGHPSHLVGRCGGYSPKLWSNAQAVDHVLEAVIVARLQIARDVAVALDVAASHLQGPGSTDYHLDMSRETHDADGMIALFEHWVRQYPIVSIEDPLGQDDWDGWVALTARLGPTVQLAGDDLFATRVDRIGLGVDRKAGNAVMIKPGQVGTLSETLDALALAQRSGFRVVVAARAGETEDTSIADLAVATAAGQVKLGAMTRTDRLAKYNRLTRIEDDLGSSVRFSGWAS